MSLTGQGNLYNLPSFPRSRGDEPKVRAQRRDVLAFSPLTRG